MRRIFITTIGVGKDVYEARSECLAKIEKQMTDGGYACYVPENSPIVVRNGSNYYCYMGALLMSEYTGTYLDHPEAGPIELEGVLSVK